MTCRRNWYRRVAPSSIFIALLGCMVSVLAIAQSDTTERTFSQSKGSIEKILQGMQSTLSGHLPVLDGFAKPGEHALDHYSRAFYQASAEVTSTPSGGCVVRIKTKVTAWYTDPSNSRSGYQLLVSNGRIESDILDQLSDQLAAKSKSSGTITSTSATAAPPTTDTAPSAPTPVRSFPGANKTYSASLSPNLKPENDSKDSSVPLPRSKKTDPLQAEADSLQELLKNTAHPKNLVAVKKSGTPVVATPSLTAKPQFLASLHDEFEMLDFNTDWVHVRISGLSRGWIWRNSVEMPDGIPDTASHAAPAAVPAADLFRVSREEAAPFPGDWEPLRSKNVKIISVQKVDDIGKSAGPKERLEYAKLLLDKNYAEVAQKPQELQGIVVIFDSSDGGMIAATTAALAQWKAGTLSDAALWHKCFFDPPETFDSTAASGSR
jgi:hypothetical protein